MFEADKHGPAWHLLRDMNSSHHSHHTRGKDNVPQQHQQMELATENSKRRRGQPPPSSLTVSAPASFPSTVAIQQTAPTLNNLNTNNQNLSQNLNRLAPSVHRFNNNSVQAHAQPLPQRGPLDADSTILQMLAAVATNGSQVRMRMQVAPALQGPPSSQPSVMEQCMSPANRTDLVVSSTSTVSHAEAALKDYSISFKSPVAINTSAPLDLSSFQFTATAPAQTNIGTHVKQQKQPPQQNETKPIPPLEQHALFASQHQFCIPFQANFAATSSSSNNNSMNQVNCMGMDAIYRSFIASSSAQPTTSLVTVKPIQAPQRHPPAQLKQRQLMQAASSGAAHPAGKQGTHTQPIPKPHNKTKQPPLPQTKTISTPLITLPLKGQAIPAHTPASAPVMVPAPGSAPQPIQPMPSKQEIFLQYNLMTGYLDPLHEEHWSEYFGLPVYNACGGQYLFCCPLHMAANQPDQCVHLPALTRILFEN